VLREAGFSDEEVADMVRKGATKLGARGKG
jgi:hypothetical protein